MKYSQFLEFGKLLEANKADINSWKTSDIELIKEADEPAKDLDTLDTKKPAKGTGWITKKGRMRKSLNKQAKKLMDGINQNVANKFLKPIKDLKIQVYKKMAEVGKGKQPKEIVAALKVDLQNIQKTQTRQMDQILKYAQNAIDINTKKITAAIEKKGLKETNTAELQTYWGLLTTQITMNLLQKINVQDDNTIGEVIKDADILKAAKQINAALNKPQKKKETELKAQIEKLKGEIKAKDDEEAKTEKPAEETKPAEEVKTEEVK
jgi:hypothetical protein